MWNTENVKTNGITNWNFMNDITRINFEITTQFEWIHITCFKLACINPSDGFQTLATSSLKHRIFSSNLSLVSQELFSNN